MAEAEPESKKLDAFTRNTTSDTLNAQNHKDDKNSNVDLDLNSVQDLNLAVDLGGATGAGAAASPNHQPNAKLGGQAAESEPKSHNPEEESQNNQSPDLIKGLSVPIELDPNFGPEKVTYDIEDLNIPIQLEENLAPTDLNALIKKLDIPCDSDAMRNEILHSKQKLERSMMTRNSRRNAGAAANAGFKLNGLPYKNFADPQDLSTNLNFRELSRKLDPNRNAFNMANKLLMPAKMGLNKLNLDDFSKLDMEGLASLGSSSLPSFAAMGLPAPGLLPGGMANPDANLLRNFDANLLRNFDANLPKNLDPNLLKNMNVTKLDVNALGKLDISDGAAQPLPELRPLSELSYQASLAYKSDLDALRGLQQAGKLRPLDPLRDGEPKPAQFLVPEHLPAFVPPSELGYPSTSEILGMAANQYAASELRLAGLKQRPDPKKKKRGSKPKDLRGYGLVEPPMLNPVELPPVTVENWAQCENCKKWRRIPLSVDPEKLPDTWVCSLNVWDPVYNSCSVPEEVYPEKVDLKPLDAPAASAPPAAGLAPEPELPEPGFGSGLDNKYPDPKFTDNKFVDKFVDNKVLDPRLPDPKLRGRQRSLREREPYFETRAPSARRKYKYDGRRYGRAVYEEAYEPLRTPTNANRYFEEARAPSRRRTHASPLVSNLSSYDDNTEVVKFSFSAQDASAHPLKDRIALFSNNLTTLLATELPHSALFLDNLKRMNALRDEARHHGEGSRKAGRGKRGAKDVSAGTAQAAPNKPGASGLDSLIDPLYGHVDLDAPLNRQTLLRDMDSMLDREVMLREAALTKENPFLREDGSINLAFARKTEWVHSHQRPPRPAAAVSGARLRSTRSSGLGAGFGDRDLRFNFFESLNHSNSLNQNNSLTDPSQLHQNDHITWFDALENSLNGDARADFGRVFKRLAAQIPRLAQPNQPEQGGSCSSAKRAEAAGSELLSTSAGLGEPEAALSDESGSSSSFSASNEYTATEYSFEREGLESADSNYATHRNVSDAPDVKLDERSSSFGSDAAADPSASEPLSSLGGGNEAQPRPLKTGTSFVNRQELMDLLYSFAKQYVSPASEPPASHPPAPDANAKRPREPDHNPDHRPVLYCKRHKYFDDLMETIVDYKEQVLDPMNQKEASPAPQSSVDELEDPLKKEEESDLLADFRDDDKLRPEESEDDSQEADEAAARIEKEIENELRRELMAKELESRFVRRGLLPPQRTNHVDYPLPNIKQLSRRFPSLDFRTVRPPPPSEPSSRLMSSYSRLFQPIPDDVALGSGRERMIQMLSVPIPARAFRRDSAPSSSASNSTSRAGSLGSLPPFAGAVIPKSEPSVAPDSSPLVPAGVKVPPGEDFKFEGLDLLSLPIPDLTGTSTQCVI